MAPTPPAGTLPSDDDVPAAERAALRRGRLRPWLPLLAAVVVNVALLMWVVLALPGLPERVPTHWGADGTPDAWEVKTLGAVAFGPLMGLGTAAFMGLIAAVLPVMTGSHGTRTPWQRVRQAGVNRGMTAGLAWVPLLLCLPVLPTTVAVLRGDDGVLPWWVMPLVVTLTLPLLLWVLSASVRRGTGWSDAVARELGYRPTPEEAAEEEKWTALGLKRDPADPATFPPKREGYGVGATVNLATPLGRGLTWGFVLLFAVGLPLVLWAVAWPR